MGRELRRKEEKKNKNKNIKKVEELDTSIKKSTIIKLVLFIAILLFVLYYIVAVFITKELKITGFDNDTETTETTDTTSTTDKILAKNIFNQKESTYYVYFYDFSDADENIDSAISGKSDWKVYRVDTSSGLNQNYVTEENGNRNVTSISDLKVKNPTIIQVTNDKVTAYHEGSSEILSLLK